MPKYSYWIGILALLAVSLVSKADEIYPDCNKSIDGCDCGTEEECEALRLKRLDELFESNSCDIGWLFVNGHCEKCETKEVLKVSEVDCLNCNQYEELRVYDSKSGECKPKK